MLTSIIIPWYTSDNDRPPVSSKLEWDSDAPLEIRITFADGIHCVSWVLARDLLREAILYPPLVAGEGDVKAWVSEGTLFLTLSNPHGEVRFRTVPLMIAQFIYHTDTVIAPGSEAVNVDALLEKIFP